MDSTVRILGFMGSLRGNRVPRPIMLETVVMSENFDDVCGRIYELGQQKRLSNSEGLLIASMYGAYEEGADINFISTDEESKEFDGVIISTPVYFGDRSSLADDFIHRTDFRDKAVGVVSSGAKRNGGQETTNVYALYDCLNKGAIITGNGPPTGQYGGTGVGGNKGAIIDDIFGLKTSYGTGRRVAQLAKTLKRPDKAREVTITFAITSENLEGSLYKEIQELPFSSDVDLRIIDISTAKIDRCKACPICPNGDLNKKYTCLINGDEMEAIHTQINKADAFILSALISPDIRGDMFQRFIERSRFIRRNHYEMSDRIFSSYSVTNKTTDAFPIRSMGSFLRQNMFSAPFYRRLGTYNLSNISKRAFVENIERLAKLTKLSRMETGIDIEYTPVGYEDAKDKELAYRD